MVDANDLKTDSRGQTYADCNNVRITLKRKDQIETDKNWAGTHLLSFRAYKENSNQLNPGPELIINNTKDIETLIQKLHLLKQELNDAESEK